ncbi:MAG: hypothetical protein ACPLRW_08750 [Moorellales bacterium]
MGIIVLLVWLLFPRLAYHRADAREARALADLSSLRLVAEAFAATAGNGRYPRPSADLSDAGSVASVMRAHGIRWGGPDGAVDPWGKPYRYWAAPLAPIPFYPLSYAVASAGADGVFCTDDDVWATDWEPPRKGNPAGRWFAQGAHPFADSCGP